MTLELKGLSGVSPICFMAAIGLLRILSEDRGLDVGLVWVGKIPGLIGISSLDELLHELRQHMKNRAKSPEWNWHDTGRKVKPQEYRQACLQMAGDSRALSFMAAFCSDTAVDLKGFIVPSRLNMTSGQQKFVANLRVVANDLGSDTQKGNTDFFKNALLGGEYEEQYSFGWDPVAGRNHAHEAISPSKSRPPGKKGLVWLAAESLALHPVVPVNGWARPLGCEKIGQEKELFYFWPLWSDAVLGLDEIRMLRALNYNALCRRPGVTEVWASEFGQSGKYGLFKPATRFF